MKVTTKTWLGIIGVLIAVVLLLAVFVPVKAQTAPTFSRIFIPDVIGPGSVSTLQFDIVNTDPTFPVTDMAFTDTLPAGVTIAAPANASTNCNLATLTAPEGGATITFSGGQLGASSSCTVLVDVTGSTPGLHTNVSGVLTSSAGASGTATDDLTVDANRPGFSKTFAPSSVSLGGRSTLTFTIDNSANVNPAQFLTFTDNLPTGLVVAAPNNASTDCNAFGAATLTAISGTSTVSLSGGGVAASSSCTVSVDVVAIGGGALDNVSGELTSFWSITVSSGKASATLDVTVTPLSLIKAFTDDPTPPGGTVTLEFTINNWDRNNAATNIGFTDDLGAVLAGLAATGLPINDVCGAGSQISGASVLTLTGGNLPAQGSCTFSVPVQVPAGAATGSYLNTTGAITGDVGGSPLVGNQATDVLFVAPVPILTKEFTDDPVAAGNDVTLEFTITNSSATSTASNFAFADELTTFLPFPLSVVLPAPGFCNGATMALVPLGIGGQGLSVTGGSLTAGDSCTFSATITIPASMPNGTYANTTTEIVATIDDTPTIGAPATDDLVVVAGPSLTKSFINDPVTPGSTIDLEFTLQLGPNAPTDATGITFTDDLAATLSGLAATGLPMNDVCGPGNGTLAGSAGDTFLTFSGGSLSPGTSCTFSVTLQVPASATHGDYPNTTSNVNATVGGILTTGGPASADLRVRVLALTKEFTDDPVLPGGAVTLEFTIDNTNSVSDTTGIVFTDNLADMLAGTTILTALPINDLCGSGSSLTGAGSFMIFSGGNLLAGNSCTFSVVLLVPAGAAAGQYLNTTSNVSASVGGSSVVANPATDILTVFTVEPPGFNKVFTPDDIPEGATSTLSFTIDNTPNPTPTNGLSFTDTLPSGVVIASPPNASTTCNGGTLTAVAGTGLISYIGGSLAANSSCTVQVDVTSSAEGAYVNISDNLTSSLGDSGQAVDTLIVRRPTAITVVSFIAMPLKGAMLGLTVGLLALLSASVWWVGRRTRK